MTNTTATRASQTAEDRATYELWKATQVIAYEAAGNTAWYSTSKALRMAKRHSTPPEDPFTGPFWAVKPWLVQEAIDWFEVAGNPRYTFTDWERLQREQRAQLAEYDAQQSAPLANLEYGRELFDRRGEFILQARKDGATWADICDASGLSRMQAHTLCKAAERAATMAAYVHDDSEEPF